MQLESRVLDDEWEETKEIKVRAEIRICPVNKFKRKKKSVLLLEGAKVRVFILRAFHELSVMFTFSFSSVPHQTQHYQSRVAVLKQYIPM